MKGLTIGCAAATACAFANRGKFHTALLDEADFAMNRAAFTENGYSKGMFYNTYCNARVTLSDGRVYVFGGHDMQSNTGLYKVTGDRYVKLAFTRSGRAAGDLRVTAPTVPAQAVPGIYLLFIVDRNGVPSVGRRVDIKAPGEQ